MNTVHISLNKIYQFLISITQKLKKRKTIYRINEHLSLELIQKIFHLKIRTHFKFLSSFYYYIFIR